MPTENRSSNTEMASLPEGYMLVERSISTERQVEAATACITRLKGVHGMRDRDLAMAAIDAAQCTAPDIALADLLPVQQHHPEPIAWMVGTAFWWTKEEAERDAAQTGLPMTPVGPLTGSAEVEQLREVIKHSDSNIQRQSLRISNQRAQLAERDALLTKMKALFRVDDPFDLYDAVCAVLSARAEPSEPTPQAVNGHRLCCKAVDDYRPGKCSCGVEIDHEIPGTSFQRLNALANQGE